jgi:hypothetical protein
MLLQDKKAHLEKLSAKCKDASTKSDVTIDEVKLGIACTQPAHPYTAWLFDEAMAYLACDEAGCDKIASAGGIPIMVQLLTCYLDASDSGVVYWACLALRNLVENHDGAALACIDIKSSLRKPDIVSVLRAASLRLRACDCEYDWAALTLKDLGV